MCIEKKKSVFLQPQIQGGAVAQLVEQRTENPCVTGSIPVSATSKEAATSSFFCIKTEAVCLYFIILI